MGALHVHQARSEYLLSRGHPSPEPVRASLDESLRGDFAKACAEALDALDRNDDQSIWMIRSVQLDIAINATLQPEQIAGYWAACFARRLHSALSRGEVFGEVVRFNSPAEFAAEFIFETATSGHPDAWYFRPFDSLRSLPADRAICEALTRDKTTAEPALRYLFASGRLECVVNRLSPALQRRILEHCIRFDSSQSSTGNVAAIVSTLLAHWRPRSGAHPLFLYIAARHDTNAFAKLVQKIVQAFLALVQNNEHALATKTARELEPFRILTEFNDRDTLAALELFNTTLDTDTTILEKISESVRSAQPQQASSRGESFETICGGIFLLIRSVIDSGVEEVIERLAASNREAAALRSTILLKCLGMERAAIHRGDPAFTILHDKTAIDWESVRPITNRMDAKSRWRILLEALTARDRLQDNSWLSASPPASDCLNELSNEELQYFRTPSTEPAMDIFWSSVARVVMNTFARRLPGFDRSSREFLRQNFLDVKGAIETDSSSEILATLQRPPLYLILSVAGLDGDRFSLPWLAGTVLQFEFTS